MPDPLLPEPSDADLIERAKSGDADSFGHLYERYAAQIFRFVYAQVAERMTAEDLTAEVFIRAWRYLPRYRERRHPFSAFLYKVARNLIIDWRRKSKNVEDWSDQLDVLGHLDVMGLNEHVRTNLEREIVGSALTFLREDYRTVLLLRFFNGLTPGEVSQIMDRSEGAIRVLQHRALKTLRERLVDSGIVDE